MQLMARNAFVRCSVSSAERKGGRKEPVTNGIDNNEGLGCCESHSVSQSQSRVECVMLCCVLLINHLVIV